jgi:hypothetical protein
MKRDLELVRKILFKMEDNEENFSFSEHHPFLKIDGYSRDLVIYHLMIMAQAGLLHSERFDFPTVEHAPPTWTNDYSISWQGHEFLSALRDDTRWKEVKQIMVKAGGFVTEVAVEVGKEIIKRAAFKMLDP